ncbi:DUF5943 domain-containing protein [Verminephrobacter aporrectodeae]|uniref:DUF5943 domain-containing protein n=1 Tax=Verminephrobacter aporrectodeae TaxID=1110389 RepID=UPI0002376F65|nr:DUF5943 domain-containing protein [Verminephrobacter aporrectodeae]
MTPQLPIDVAADSGIWTTDGLPMIYMPRHFFVNNHVETEAVVGRERYAPALYKAGHRSAHFWCQQEAVTHGLKGLAVYRHYLQRLSQRGWGQFAFLHADADTGCAQVRVAHSVFVLAQGIAGVPVRRDRICYAFAGWFAGAMDWVLESGGSRLRTTCAEDRCAAEHAGHTEHAGPAEGAPPQPPHCIFTVHPL